MKRIVAVVAALLVVAFGAWLVTNGEEEQTAVGDKEARDLLARAVAAGDDNLCELSHSKLMCKQALTDAEAESWIRPDAAPVVVASRVMPATKDRPELRVLDLRITASGRPPYDSSFPVIRDEGVASALNPVYWYPATWS